jgi:hypothetical protein
VVEFAHGASLLDLVGLSQDVEALLGFPVETFSRGGIPPADLVHLELETL